jgi:DNA-binding transcriptional regulator GbsR (MarR family)
MDEIDRDFIGLYQSLSGVFGFDSLLLTVFAKLYIEPAEIAMEDLAEETGYSLASISNKVKTLESMGVVKRTTRPGSKKVFLYTEKNYLKIMKEYMMKKEEQRLKLVKEKLPTLIRKYKNPKSEREKKKLKILEDYHRQLLKFEKVISHVRKEIEKMEL